MAKTPAAYDELVMRMRAAVKPTDTIDEMHTADIVSLVMGDLALAPFKMEFGPSART
jgi:hypothetical protein